MHIYIYTYICCIYGCGQHQRGKCAYIKDNCTLFSMMSTTTVLNHVLSPLAPVNHNKSILNNEWTLVENNGDHGVG